MWVVRFVLIALLAVAALPAAGQTKVLKGKEVTAEVLVNALVPPPRTRSFRPDGPPPPPPSKDIMVTFATNSAELTDEGRQTLDVVAKALNDQKLATFNFVLEGHADPRGTADWNQRLSEERAESVRQYLASQNVSPERLKPVGKGDREPLNTVNPAAPENRRVRIVTME
jgi:outer membrane protein OmpA-like peptidoglycan-associated protein